MSENIFFNKLLKFGFAAILIAIPLYPKFPFLVIQGIQVSVRLEDFLIFAVFLVWLVTIRLKVISFFLKGSDARAAAIFILVGLVSLFSAVLITQTVVPLVGLLHWARRVEYLICFFIAYSALKNKEDLAFFLKCIFLVLIYVSIYGVLQKHFGVPIVTTQNSEYSKGLALFYREGGHLVSTFAGHYDMASYLLLVLPLIYALLFARKNVLSELKLFKKVIFSRVLFFALIISGMWLLVNAASRISIISYLGGASLVLFVLRKYK